MLSVMKAQLYQMRKDVIIPICFLGMLLVEGAIVLIYALEMKTAHNLMEGMPMPTAGTLFVGSFPMIAVFGMTFTVVLIAAYCCSDFSDKTINYELLTGHRRIESYLGRAVPSLVLGLLGYLALVLLPLAALTAVYGWGGELSLADTSVRVLLSVVICARFICEFIFISFLAKKRFAVMALGFLVMMSSQTVPLIFNSTSIFLALTNMNLVSHFDNNWVTFGLRGNINTIYEAGIPPKDIIATIVFSVVCGAVFLFLGYVFFRNDDIE